MSTLKLPTILRVYTQLITTMHQTRVPFTSYQSNVAPCRTKTDSRVLSTRHPDFIKSTRCSAAPRHGSHQKSIVFWLTGRTATCKPQINRLRNVLIQRPYHRLSRLITIPNHKNSRLKQWTDVLTVPCTNCFAHTSIGIPATAKPTSYKPALPQRGGGEFLISTWEELITLPNWLPSTLPQLADTA